MRYKYVTPNRVKLTEKLSETETKITCFQKMGDDWHDLAGNVVDLSGVHIEPLADAEKARLAAEQAKAQATAAKLKGAELAGVMVSLTEENQNGIASVLTGANLAAEVGAPFFPLNFNAATAAGLVSIRFETLTDFEGFALEFMAARQAFFQ